MANRWKETWDHVKENGGDRQMMADSLGMDRGRLNQLILGKVRPTLGETASLTGGRRGNYVVYKDANGKEHSTYTAQGKSFADIAEDWEDLDDMLDDIAYDKDYPVDGNVVIAIRDQYNPSKRFVSMSRSHRSRQIGLRPQKGKSLGFYVK